MSDYFCKIDPSKICQLRVIVRKLEPAASTPNHIIGKPEEISEFIENSHLKQTKPLAAETNNKLINLGTEDTPIKLEDLSDEPTYQPAQNQPPKQSSSALV